MAYNYYPTSIKETYSNWSALVIPRFLFTPIDYVDFYTLSDWQNQLYHHQPLSSPGIASTLLKEKLLRPQAVLGGTCSGGPWVLCRWPCLLNTGGSETCLTKWHFVRVLWFLEVSFKMYFITHKQLRFVCLFLELAHKYSYTIYMMQNGNGLLSSCAFFHFANCFISSLINLLFLVNIRVTS